MYNNEYLLLLKIEKKQGLMITSFLFAVLKRNFKKDPEMMTEAVGAFVSLECIPPEGNPPPKVWRFYILFFLFFYKD